MTNQIWGFVLLTWFFANATTWLFSIGFEMKTKYKLIIPNAVIAVEVGCLIAAELMGF